MAELVNVLAASHTPVMLNFPDAAGEADRQSVFDGFHELGRRLAESRPQALVVLSTDHLHNFFLDNFPAFCIGAADSYDTPIEHWLNAERRTLPGDPALGGHLLARAMESGFDPSFSLDLTLDHGSLTPIELAGLSRELPIVPILVNCVQPPLPTMARCLAFGEFLGEALRDYQDTERVAVLATGGVSHDIATPRMGMVNEEFDRRFLDLLGEDGRAAADYARDHVHEAGNGAEEVRMWLIAAGAAAGSRTADLEVIFYRPIPEWYTGIAVASWATA